MAQIPEIAGAQQDGSDVGGKHPAWANEPLAQDAGLAQQSFPAGTLYMVGLPIGNAADITLRALWVLSIADAIACEDTRETKKILTRFHIDAPTLSVHEHNEAQGAQRIIALLREGKRVALVTDAGTPGVSDPGARAAAAVRAAGFPVSPIPGATAMATALSAAGLTSYSFSFAGFLPPNEKARRAALSRLSSRPDAFVIYEAPHRIVKLLTDLAGFLAPERRVVVCRELTKKFESFYAVSAGELASWAAAHEPRGEYVVLVDGEEEKTQDIDEVTRRWARALAEELPVSKAAAIAARASGVRREVLYADLLACRKAEEGES